MLRTRLIPCLLIRNRDLVKTVRFDKPSYLGDPINAVRIFSELEADELVVLDIGATPAGQGPDFEYLRELASEAFMPLTYGGGVTSIEQMAKIFWCGFEKIALNTSAVHCPELIHEATKRFGSQSVIASVDAVRDEHGGYQAVVAHGRTETGEDPAILAARLEEAGAGEILLNSVDRDGTWEGFELGLIERISRVTHVPVVALGGAGNLAHCREAVDSGASAVAAGSMFVYQKKGFGVLINYPRQSEIRAWLP